MPTMQHIVTSEGQTLLPEYVGMYRLTVADKETYWIVQRNVLSAKLPVHVKYDLKGSTIDRSASTKERVSVVGYICSEGMGVLLLL